MRRKVCYRVQRIHCQLTGPAIAGRLSVEPFTTGRSDFTAGVCVQSS